ncbi:copper homeostasis protein CutC [Jeotgalibaca sp. MA1X17-3]|uniref:copper homeostasis protein CutC n=1 Tax=Jeotgalibaca sp. MA1X17-3 TaxID=2908211 RepID=UPI001F43046E|nr:copper homeostasis protein CutC [Jeotgalibaca sp. MA1X17-3]UJF15541.1 copper homeostasis protein CutC [Jeotgalibaca sp. MA1X17-3]
MKPVIVEVCSGSVQDCIYAEQAGANRIELNSGLYLGGLTPSIATLIEAKKQVQIPIVAMVRPRAGGFFYNKYEKETMFTDAKILMEYGVDGIVFGFLNEDRSIDETNTKALVDFCHKNQVEAIFHRAFDQTPDAFKAIESLISCNVDRILTSGQKESADQGVDILEKLEKEYGTQIELCVGAGVNKENVQMIIEKTKLNQVHSSFKKWYLDPTTEGKDVSYRYSDEGDYEGVGVEKLSDFMEVTKDLR